LSVLREDPTPTELLMTVPTSRPSARVPGYDLSAPTDIDARAMLQRVFGEPRATQLWDDACRLAGIRPPCHGPADLARAATALAAAGGAAVTIARSIEIRLRTHARLAARAPSSTGAGA
jgi:hypothetical protein